VPWSVDGRHAPGVSCKQHHQPTPRRMRIRFHTLDRSPNFRRPLWRALAGAPLQLSDRSEEKRGQSRETFLKCLESARTVLHTSNMTRLLRIEPAVPRPLWRQSERSAAISSPAAPDGRVPGFPRTASLPVTLQVNPADRLQSVHGSRMPASLAFRRGDGDVFSDHRRAHVERAPAQLRSGRCATPPCGVRWC